jgi:hypothetical protein
LITKLHKKLPQRRQVLRAKNDKYLNKDNHLSPGVYVNLITHPFKHFFSFSDRTVELFF